MLSKVSNIFDLPTSVNTGIFWRKHQGGQGEGMIPGGVPTGFPYNYPSNACHFEINLFYPMSFFSSRERIGKWCPFTTTTVSKKEIRKILFLQQIVELYGFCLFYSLPKKANKSKAIKTMDFHSLCFLFLFVLSCDFWFFYFFFMKRVLIK